MSGGTLSVERVLPDGYEVVEADLPAVVTVSNELGNARYPNMRGDHGGPPRAANRVDSRRPRH